MRGLRLVLIVALLIMAVPGCDDGKKDDSGVDDLEEVQEINQGMVDDLVNGNSAGYKAIMSEDWAICGPNGYMIKSDYEQVVFPMIDGGFIKNITINSIQWDIEDDLAVARSHDTLTLDWGEGPMVDDYQSTVIYRKRNGEWKQVFVHQSAY